MWPCPASEPLRLFPLPENDLQSLSSLTHPCHLLACVCREHRCRREELRQWPRHSPRPSSSPRAPVAQGTGGEDGLPAAPLSGERSLGEPCYSWTIANWSRVDNRGNTKWIWASHRPLGIPPHSRQKLKTTYKSGLDLSTETMSVLTTGICHLTAWEENVPKSITQKVKQQNLTRAQGG